MELTKKDRAILARIQNLQNQLTAVYATMSASEVKAAQIALYKDF